MAFLYEAHWKAALKEEDGQQPPILRLGVCRRFCVTASAASRERG